MDGGHTTHESAFLTFSVEDYYISMDGAVITFLIWCLGPFHAVIRGYGEGISGGRCWKQRQI